MHDPPLIRTQGLGLRRAGRDVFAGVDLQVDAGTIMGLLGMNGAGKSSLLQVLAGVLAANDGTVHIAGTQLREDPRAARRLIGWLPERAPLYRELTVNEALGFAAALRGLKGVAAKRAVDCAIERCDLASVSRRLCGNLSKGFAQRTGLAQAIVHEPPVLLLDEPTAGLDPVQAQRFHQLLQALRPGRAMLMSSHQLIDVQRSCDQVAILHSAQLDQPLHAGDVAELERRFLQRVLGAAA